MLKIISCLIGGLALPSTVFAEKILFKQAINPKPQWYFFMLFLLIVFTILFLLSKKKQSVPSEKSACHVLERKYLDTKTKIFVIQYQQQLFLLADNQHALAWQLLTGTK